MLIGHHHAPGLFDADDCRACARRAGLPDHYDRVQEEGTQLRQARQWARVARRHALWALGCSGIGVLLALLASPW